MCSLIIGIISLILFIYFVKKEPNQFRNVFYLFMFLFFCTKGFFYLWRRLFPTLESADIGKDAYVLNNSGVIYSYIFIAFILIFVFFSWYLVFNFFVLVRQEGFAISYFILPISSTSVYMWIISRFVFQNIFYQEIFSLVILYIPLLYFAYFLYSKLYVKIISIADPDYIIIHGAALINDSPTPLLKKRLDKGIEVFNASFKNAFFIVSGGQGADEIVSEAEAMKNYLINKGIPESKIIKEDKSHNTLENLLFSKRIIKDTDKKVIIVSNDYHILRCVIYAKNIGLKVFGVASKTVGYYKIFGEFREVVAFMVRYKLLFFIYLFTALIVSFIDRILL